MKFLTIGTEVLLALLSAVLLIFSFPEFDLGFLAWVALVPLLVTLKNKSLKSAFGLSLLTGVSFFMGICYWMKFVRGFSWFEFFLWGLYLGSYIGLFGLALNFITGGARLSRIVVAPALWVSTEYLRSHMGFLGIPWGLLGHSQYLNLPIIQISSLTGVYGISFLIVMVNATLSESILAWIAAKQGTLVQHRRKLLVPAVVTTALVGVSLAYGFFTISNEPWGDKIRMSVVQANIPRDMTWKREFQRTNLNKHIRLTQEATKIGDPSLIVWPGSSVEGYFTSELYLLNTLSTHAKEISTHLLIGSSQRPKFGSREFRRKNWLNSAFLLSPNGAIVGQYNKIHLFPFGEYLPYDWLWPLMFASAPRDGHAIPGNEYNVFSVNGAKFGVAICWESIFPDLVRGFVKNGANFMVNITNEVLFGETAAPYQFLAMNVFRAVENRISIARSANTGISGFIDPYGRIMGKVKNGDKDIFVDGYLTMDIPLSQQRTFYTEYGDIFTYINLLLTFFMLAVSVLKIRTG